MTDKVTALDLPMVDPLPEATQKYFDICQEKLGMVPNVLQAYAFDISKQREKQKIGRKTSVIGSVDHDLA